MGVFSDFSLQFDEDIYEEDDEGNITRIPPFDELVFNAASCVRYRGLEKLCNELNKIISEESYEDARKISEKYARTPFMEAGKEREEIHRIKKIVETMIDLDPNSFEELEEALANKA